MKKVLSAALFFYVCLMAPLVHAESQGPNTPSTTSGTNWTNSSNITAVDGSYAVYSNTAQDFLKLTGFGFTIPTGATLDGYSVNIKGYGSAAAPAGRDYDVAITTDGSTAESSWLNDIFQATNSYAILGSSENSWSSAASVSDMNGSNFGLLVRDADTGSDALNFDYMDLTIWYTPSGGSSNHCHDGQTATSASTAGTSSGTNWTGPGNTTSSNNSYALYNNTSQDYLILSNFGFSVPTDATVDGVVIQREGYGGSANIHQRKFHTNLTKDASTSAGDWYIAILNESSDTTEEIGGSADKWQTTLSPSDVNSSNFGILIRDSNTTAAAIAFDYVTVTVCYTEAAASKRIIFVN